MIIVQPSSYLSVYSVSTMTVGSMGRGGSRTTLYLGDFRLVHSGKFGRETSSTASTATFLSLV